jgi:hypothetical protein
MLGFQYRMLRRQVFQPVLKAGKQAEFINCKEKLELANVYRLEWGNRVIDIRERYPFLPLSETLAIAQPRGIRYPTVPGTKEPIVLTKE